MLNVGQMQQQIKQLQKQMEQIVEDQKQQDEMKYKGPNIKIKLVISNTEFMTSAATLLSKHHGITLFIEEFTAMQQNNDEKENIKQSESQPGSAKPSQMVELYFDRNPDLFEVILDYLRGYEIKMTLRDLTINQLQKLKNDCAYFKIESLFNVIIKSLEARFDIYCGSPLIELSANGTVATRSSINNSQHVSVPVFGILQMPEHGSEQRYVEFNISSHGSRYIMIGVTEAKAFKFGPYPGHANTSGCSLYGANGHLYRTGGSEAWSAAWCYGDRIGTFVKLNKDNNTAAITFYRNGTQVKNELNLTTYMNVANGVLFVANIHSANEQVQIVQDPIVPQ